VKLGQESTALRHHVWQFVLAAAGLFAALYLIILRATGGETAQSASN
jgi:hypothetical protein